MNTYKHGDAVTCTINGTQIDDAKISIDRDGTSYICQNFISDFEAEDKLGYENSWILDDDFTSPDVTDLKLATKKKDINDISTYEVGDVLVNGYGETVVLSISGRIIIISLCNKFDEAFDRNYTVKDLIDSCYKFKDTQPGKFSVENPPKDWEEYFFWDISKRPFHDVSSNKWNKDGDITDMFLIKIGNCHRTEQEAREWYYEIVK